ncbi:hypothetical protein [Desulfobacter sp.]|uniref:hypothetical protein n=1 Tax=Desulfobacter sp. TaxID=2294 RepID=UPI003D12634C
MINEQTSEKIAVIGTIDPQTVVNTEVFTDVVDMSKYHQAMFICALGNMAAETIDFTVYYCDSDGGNATALKSATQLAADASANDNKQIVISVRDQELLTVAETTRYLKAGLVTGGASGGPACVVALGVDSKYGPASGSDLASVAEIVTALD